MKNFLLISLMALFLSCWTISNAYSQQSVSGRVVGVLEEALPGVTVLEKGTANGATTDVNGRYSLAVTGPEAVLVFSFIGYNTQEIKVRNQSQLDVQLEEDLQELEEVVVTALGIEKDSRGLSYTTQQLGGEELTKARDPNLMNSLAGKVAGVNINRSAGGVGGSVKVNIRGNRSATGGNQPLYVIDGVPLLNSSPAQPLNAFGGDRNVAGRDGGDGIANLNPDDIESINVLKGASASALYGSQAANGVILITTKKGKKGASSIRFSSNATIEQPLILPDFQRKYGQTAPGSKNSWGEALPSGAPVVDVEDFYRTGATFINSLAITGGSENSQTYFSYANTTSEGILPTSEYHKNNFTFRQSTRLFDEKLAVDANISYLVQNATNRPSSGLYFNPLVGLYLFPRGVDFQPYEDDFEVFNEERKLMAQNWFTLGSDADDFNQNPYWLLNRTAREDSRNRVIGSVSMRYKIMPWMYLQGRLNVDRVSDNYRNEIYAFTHPNLAHANGRYIRETGVERQVYSDLLLNINQQFGSISLSAAVGGSINDHVREGDIMDSERIGLHYANVFTAANLVGNTLRKEIYTHQQIQALFATAQLGYREMIFLDLTGRNDWASSLAFTPNGSYFYPSAGLTLVLSEMLSMPASVSLAKIRGSYARVGNDVPAYVTNPLNSIGPDGTIIYNDEAPFTDLKPEISSSIEFGADLGLLNNRLKLSLTWYKTNTTNQYFRIATSNASGYSFRYINAGNIENRGIEALLNYQFIRSESFNWSSSLNFSRNVNEVKELSPEINDLFRLTEAGSNNYESRIEVGGSFGDIYGLALQRAPDGSIYVNEDGSPVPTEEFVKLGNPNPDWLMGWNNEFDYKGVALSFLLDARVGGEVMSLTQAMLDAYGVSQQTADARDAGGVGVPATIVAERNEAGEIITPERPYNGKIPAQAYYSAVGGRAGITGEYVYSATNVRLREFSLGYRFPQKMGIFENLQLSLVGRNLFFLYNEAPYDPEISMSTGNNLQGIDVFSLPTTRSYGLNLKVNF